MGGYSYDRDVYSTSSSDGWGGGSSSSVATRALSATRLDDSMLVKNRKVVSHAKHPIICFLDVTGSNIDFAKIVYDKMPMFYGQIEQKGYLKDFELSICAVGDAYSDYYPLQVPDFAKGIEIDDWLKKLVLEGHGGGQRCETYELAAYSVLSNFEFDNGAEPIIIFIGDESPYSTIPKSLIQSYISSDYDGEDIDTNGMFKQLLDRYPNTFMFLNPYQGYIDDDNIYDDWKECFLSKSKHLIRMQKDNEKAIVDLMLGVIAMVGEHSLDSYKVDMLGRGQDKARISTVESTLKDVSTELAVVPSATVSIAKPSANNRKTTNRRL